MATVLNGTAGFTYFPGIPYRSGYTTTDYQLLKSCNSPMVYQVGIEYGNMDLSTIPQNSGDVVNVVFEIYMRPAGCHLQGIDSSNRVAEVRKGCDIPLDVYGTTNIATFITTTGLNMSGNLNLKTFTCDISSIVKTHLTYALIPVGRGSFNSPNRQGNMGQGLSGTYGDRIYSPLGNGAMQVWVYARFEVLNSDGLVETAVTGTGNTYRISEWTCLYTNASGNAQHGYGCSVFNSTEQSNERQGLNQYKMDVSLWNQNDFFFSNCPNGDTSTSWTKRRYNKTIGIEDEAEFLYFFIMSVKMSTIYTVYSGQYNFQSRIFNIYMKVEAWDGTTMVTKYLDTNQDTFWYSIGYWQDATATGFAAGTFLASPPYPKVYLGQNVSPEYINNNAGAGVSTPITASTLNYRVSLEWMDNESGTCDGAVGAAGHLCVDNGGSWDGDTWRMSEYRYFQMDNRKNIAFPYVRLHWLNGKGSIDSFTFRCSQTESLSREISTYERKPNNPQWGLEPISGADTSMIDFTWGTFLVNWGLEIGSDQYKTDIEVMNVKTQRGGTVYSEPLNQEESKWLQEIFNSPNVWLEVDNGRGVRNNSINPDTYRSETDYAPIVIESGDTITLDSEQRMVQYQIKYLMGNSNVTQSN